MSIVILGAALAVAAAPAPARAPGAVRTERAVFPPGTTVTAVQGAVKGYDSVRYLVRVRGGQTLAVALKTTNAANTFDIVPPGSSQAMFVGAVSGNIFRGKVLAGGDYAVQVYLTRDAARRGETAAYTLAIGASG